MYRIKALKRRNATTSIKYGAGKLYHGVKQMFYFIVHVGPGGDIVPGIAALSDRLRTVILAGKALKRS